MRVSVSIMVPTKQPFLSSRCLKQNAKQSIVCSNTFLELQAGKARRWASFHTHGKASGDKKLQEVNKSESAIHCN